VINTTRLFKSLSVCWPVPYGFQKLQKKSDKRNESKIPWIACDVSLGVLENTPNFWSEANMCTPNNLEWAGFVFAPQKHLGSNMEYKGVYSKDSWSAQACTPNFLECTNMHSRFFGVHNYVLQKHQVLLVLVCTPRIVGVYSHTLQEILECTPFLVSTGEIFGVQKGWPKIKRIGSFKFA
jgi:hypothetical protein